VLGQNTAAIAALEAQYGEMWATDSATMYNYAGRSANTSAVKPFTAAPQMTNPAGTAHPSAPPTGASAGAAQNSLRSTMSKIRSALGQLSTGTQAPAAADDPVKDALTTG